MESELTCAVCSEIYSRGLREPVLLPNCGHTFCRVCLLNVEALGNFDCPSCRRPHTGSSVSHLPTIYALLSLSENFRKLQNETLCTKHGSTTEFWCRNCKEGLCGHCLLAGHLTDGHVVEKGAKFVAEKKEEIFTCGSLLVKDLDIKKEIIIEKIIELIKQMVVNTEESKVLHNSKIEVESLLQDVSKISGIDSALTTSARIESLHTTTQRILVTSTKEEHNTHDKCRSCIHMSNRNSFFSRQESLTLEEDTEVSGLDGNTEHILISEPRGKSLNRQTCTEATPECSEEQSYYGDGACGSDNNLTKALHSSPATALRTKAPWPLQCCIASSDGRRGRLKWENDKLHMYGLSREYFDAQFMIQLSVVEWLISAQRPEVFLDLSSQYHHLGRIYINLYGYLRRAQHFLALCLGSLGPSYKFSKFHGVVKRGAPGETLAGGKYITNDNTISVQGLIPRLEWGGAHIREKKAGLVVGATGSNPSEDAFFHICTRDQDGKKFGCAFGEVTTGMKVLHEAVEHLAAGFDVIITDVGVVLSQNT